MMNSKAVSRGTMRCLVRSVTIGALGSLGIGLVGCGGGDSTPTVGTLRLALTDAPSCGFDRVYVTVNKVQVHQSASATGAAGEAGWRELTIPARRIDLLSLTNGALQELGALPLPAGTYRQIRLVLADNPTKLGPAEQWANSVVPSDTKREVALTTPGAQSSGFKLNAQFEVLAGQVADLVLDFDACKSIVSAGNSDRYNLKPVVSVVKRLATEIQGYVNPTAAAGVIVSTRDPENNLRSTIPDPETGLFRLAYLPEGSNYTVVVASPNRATFAVTGIPVSIATSVTQLNTAGTSINPPASATATLSGVVRNSGNVLLTDATVTARQELSGGAVLDVAVKGVNPDNASYTMTLPVVAPFRASYVAGGALVFSPEAASVAGAYKVYGAAPGYSGQMTSFDVSLAAGASVTKDLLLFP